MDRLALVIAIVVGAVRAALGAAVPLPEVFPPVKQMTPGQGAFELDEHAAVLVSEQATWGTRVAARAVQLGIRERCGLDLPIVRISEQRDRGPLKAIWVIEPRLLRPPDSTIGVKELEFTEPMVYEGYFLRVDAIEVVVHGASDAGSYYAAQTLLQLIRPARRGSLWRKARGPSIPCLWLADWPSRRERTVPGTVRVPSEADALEQLIRTAARYRLNGIAKSALPTGKAIGERLGHVAKLCPVRFVEKPGAIGEDTPLARAAAEADDSDRLLAAYAQDVWGPPATTPLPAQPAPPPEKRVP